MPIHPVPNRPAPTSSTTPSPSTQPHLRGFATRAAVVATTSAAAALLTLLPAGAVAPAPPAAPAVSASVVPVAVTAPAADPAAAVRASAVQVALSKIGSPYRWGGTGPSSFDCSGLVSWAFAQAGVQVPRTSRAQAQTGAPVSRANLQPGDLVFFYSPVRHVGIYIGNGQMVHSSTSGKPVAVTDIAGRPFHSARRI